MEDGLIFPTPHLGAHFVAFAVLIINWSPRGTDATAQAPDGVIVLRVLSKTCLRMRQNTAELGTDIAQ